jgi:hypothetical protein
MPHEMTRRRLFGTAFGPEVGPGYALIGAVASATAFAAAESAEELVPLPLVVDVLEEPHPAPSPTTAHRSAAMPNRSGLIDSLLLARR